MVAVLTVMLCTVVVMVDGGDPENEIHKKGTYEMDILNTLNTIKAEMQSLRTHLSKLSRRSKLMYSILKAREKTEKLTKGEWKIFKT